jgi:hypothetical protein
MCFYRVASVLLATFLLHAVTALGQAVAGSSVEDGGSDTLGMRLNSAADGDSRLMTTVTRPASIMRTGSIPLQPLLSDVVGDRSIDLRWISRSKPDDSALDRRWGRFILPLETGTKSVDFSSASYLILHTRPADGVSMNTRYSVRLRDESDRSGPQVRVDGRNLELFGPDRSTTVAIAVTELGQGVDLSKVRSIVIEPDGAHPNNVPVGWYLDGIALTRDSTVAGLHIRGAVDLGDRIAVTWDGRADTRSVRAASSGRTIGEAQVGERQTIVERARLGSEMSLSLLPIAGSVVGAGQQVALPPA